VRNIKGAAPTSHASPSTLRTERVILQATIVFVLAIAVRAIHLLQMRESPLYQVLICDARQYDQWAERIASGQWLGGSEVFYQTPLYPYCLAIQYAVFGHSVWLVRIGQAVLGSLACVFLARAGSRFFSPPVGTLAGILLAVYPPSIFFDGIVQKASLDLVLMTSLLWVMAASQSRPRLVLFGAAGVLCGATTLNRENAAVLIPVLLAWVVALSWSQPAKTSFSRGLVFCLAVAAVLLPVGLRNVYVGRVFTLTTAQMGPNFFIGNHLGASGVYEPLRASRGDPRYERDDARLLAEDDLKRSLSAREVSQYWLERSWADIKRDPMAWLRLLSWKWFLTWNSVELIDAESLGTHQRHSAVLNGLGWVLHFGVLCPLAVLGAWWTRRDWPRLWPLYAILASLSVAVTLFYVFARYRYPLVPVVALFASAGLCGLWDRIRARGLCDSRELVAGVMLFTAAAVACNWRLNQADSDDALTYFNVGTSLVEVGRPRDAMVLLKQAAALEPRQPATYVGLGRASAALGQLPQARIFFEQALRLNPNDGIAYFNLADVAARQGDQDRAVECLRQAIEFDSLLAPAYRALGRIELQRGDVADAVRHFRRAAEIEPNLAGARADLSDALLAQGHLADAVHELRAAVKFDPGSVAASNNLAWILATSSDDAVRDGAEAIALADAVCRATDYDKPELLDTLAAAYAESGRFDKALAMSARAIELARGSPESQLSKLLESHRRLFLEHRALREGGRRTETAR
jgi:tetratricopeptide (TPR) repeat protein